MSNNIKAIVIGIFVLSSFSFGTESYSNSQKDKPAMERKQKISKEEFYKKLNLSDEQKSKLDTILKKFDDNMKSNSPEKEGSPPKKENMDKLFDSLESEAKKILSDNQFNIFKSLLPSYMAPPGLPPADKR